MTKAVIFDFDGTIANSFELFVVTLHALLHKTEPLTQRHITELRGKQIKEITAELGIKSWQLPFFVIKGRRAVARNFSNVEVFLDIPTLIKTLAANNYKLFVVSTNDGEVISAFLKKLNLDQYFEQIYSDIGLTGKSKALKKLLKKHHYLNDDSTYVGDEARDIEAAHKVGIECISVEWGYSTSESLKSHNPDYLVSKPQEILNILENKNPKLSD